MAENDKDLFFVKVKETASIQRSVLESLRDVVDTLQRYDRIKEVREQKLHKINELRTKVKDINKLLLRLKNALPDAKIKTPHLRLRQSIPKSLKSELQKPVPSPKKSKGVKRVVAPKPAPPNKKSELDVLEDELTAIENKLKGLS